MEQNVIETYMDNAVAVQNLKATVDGLHTPVVVLPNGNKLESVEKYMEKPLCIKECIDFDDLRGFVDYVNDFKTDKTMCFANGNRIYVIFDGYDKDNPSWQYHAAKYTYTPSERWKLWVRNHNQWHSQEDFADFLDSGLTEIIDPQHSDILDLVKQFRATVKQEVVSDISNGGSNFTYSKDVRGTAVKSQIEIPEFITVRLMPYEGLDSINQRIDNEDDKIPAYDLRVKFNFRMRECQGIASVEFKPFILNFQQAASETLEAVRTAIKASTGVTTYIGG